VDDVLDWSAARRRALEHQLPRVGQACVELRLCAVERGCHSFHVQLREFQARTVLDALVKYGVTTLCAPPTVWRMLIREHIADYNVSLREAVSAGEPLNPEVITQAKAAWGLTIRDGFGQTETTASAIHRDSRSRLVPWAGRFPATESISSAPRAWSATKTKSASTSAPVAEA